MGWQNEAVRVTQERGDQALAGGSPKRAGGDKPVVRKSVRELVSASRQEITKKGKGEVEKEGQTGRHSGVIEAWGAPRIGVSDGGEMSLPHLSSSIKPHLW